MKKVSATLVLADMMTLGAAFAGSGSNTQGSSVDGPTPERLLAFRN